MNMGIEKCDDLIQGNLISREPFDTLPGIPLQHPDGTLPGVMGRSSDVSLHCG